MMIYHRQWWRDHLVVLYVLGQLGYVHCLPLVAGFVIDFVVQLVRLLEHHTTIAESTRAMIEYV